MSTRSDEENSGFQSLERGREWINGFLLLGVLVGLLGSLLITWQYHIDTEPELIGLHFLAFNAGYVLAVSAAQKLLLKIPIRTVALLACLIGAGSLFSLCLLIPPVAAVWRMAGLGFVGFSGGALATSLLHVLEPWFSGAPARALNIAGALFGAGCTLATLIVGAAYLAGSVQIETALLAAVPLIFFVLFFRGKFSVARRPFPLRPEVNRRHAALQDLRSIAAVLFSLLLFFQSGNEFLIAGWLPLFLIQRLGANPVLAMLALASYFLSLTLGRVVIKRFLPSHHKAQPAVWKRTGRHGRLSHAQLRSLHGVGVASDSAGGSRVCAHLSAARSDSGRSIFLPSRVL